MQTYVEMIDSGVGWIGRIPVSWRSSRIGYIAGIDTGNSIKDDEKNKYINPNNARPYISSKDINAKTTQVNYDNGLFIPINSTAFKVAKKNSILLCIEGGSAGRKITYLDRDVSFVNKLCNFDVRNGVSKFFYYYLRSKPFRSEFSLNLTGLIGGVSKAKLSSFSVPFPTLVVQQKIANFLDVETAKIDNLIAKQERLLKLLEEKRRATITQAVTRGLNPDVELKETNIPWLGKVPVHWDILSLRYLLRAPVSDGPHETPTFINNGVPFLSVDGIKDGELDLVNVRYISKEDHFRYSKKSRVEKGDILMGKAASTGKIAQVKTDQEFSVWSPLAILKFNALLNIDFIEYALKSNYVQYHIDILCTNNTQKNISMKDIQRLAISLPSTGEQDNIVNYLDAEKQKLDCLKQKIQTQIALLHERRTSLISHAVTGKVKI